MGDELKSCPFCDTEMKRHDHCFAHPRPEDGDCILRHYSFDKGKAGAWNTRTETQSQATIDELVGALREARAFIDTEPALELHGCIGPSCSKCKRRIEAISKVEAALTSIRTDTKEDAPQ